MYKNTECIITENLAGYINLKDCCFHSIWKALKLNASVTLKIKNMSNHIMRVKIIGKKCTIIKICPNQERILTATNVHNICVQCCLEDDRSCFGSFQLIIHYPFENKKHDKKCSCEDVCWYGSCKCSID